MIEENFRITTKDEIQLFVYKWLPKSTIKAVLLLVHGSVEHAFRYKEFAEFLTQNDIAVIAPDLRGHGKTVDLNGQYSFLGDNGWNKMIDDIGVLKKQLVHEYSGIPLFIFGHSMGSMLVRDFISRDSDNLKGAIVMGTSYGSFTLLKLSVGLLSFLMLFRKSNSTSLFFNNAIYGRFNRSVKDRNTTVDFISRDTKEVQKYIDDPYCGVTLTLNYAQQMIKGSLFAADKKCIESTRKVLPIVLLSGTDDPVGGRNASEVRKIHQVFKESGHQNIELKLYDKARHELLNDLCKQEVMSDIFQWMQNQMS